MVLARLISQLRRRPVRIALSIAFSIALGVLLVLTIHYTRLDLQWLAFLGGVLFAAVLALVSQASKAEWLLLRRSRQLERMREQFAEETARGRNALQGLQAAEARIRLLGAHLPLPLFYFDRSTQCRYHNRAAVEWLGLAAGAVDGKPLREVFGNAVAAAMAPRIQSSLAGEIVDYELQWPGRHSIPVAFRARQIPYSPDNDSVIGFYLVLWHPPAAAAQAGGSAPARDGESGSEEALYLDSITDELMTAPNPRGKLEQALQQNEFLLFAQRVLPLRGGMTEPECYEILLRLREEEDHLMPPGGFIPVAERYGMLERIDCWVVQRLVAWCLEHRERFPGSRIPMFCVNLSSASLRSGEFPQFVRALLERCGFPARALCFEVSQPDLISLNDETRRLFAGLRAAGCRASIDDFGSAKVAFTPLHGMPIDYLKIDGTIIQRIGRDAAELAKARAIHAVCRKAGVRTIAEFVETGETLGALRGIGIDYVQGFGIARPAPIEQVFQTVPQAK